MDRMINEEFMEKDVIQSLTRIICIFILSLFISVEPAFTWQTSKPADYAGSVSCCECHEKFYTLWSTSHHGLAMQPYTKAFAENNLTPQTEDITIKNKNYTLASYLSQKGEKDEAIRTLQTIIEK